MADPRRLWNSFVDQVRAAVDASGTSRSAICRAIGLDKAVMSRFMAGKGFLSERSLNALAAELGLTVVAGGRRKDE
ncbi:MAG: hypothetical protein ACAI43_09260 [Phycisphaerae bacterium]|nr:hypothetical protein [Tepidisphaeraceae bacterium]